MEAIDAYLAQQSDVGKRDSEGSFTVSGLKALEKLASHQLPRTSAWILKMVQAGVAGEASGMWFSHTAKSCRIAFSGTDFGGLEDICSKWTDSDPVLTTAQNHLMVALRTVSFSRRSAVLIAHHSAEFGVRTVFWNGASLSGIEADVTIGSAQTRMGWPNPGEMVFFVSSSPLGDDEKSVSSHGVKDVVAAEFKELHNFAVSCPVPIWVDSRPVNHFGLEDVSMTRQALTFSVQGADPLHSLPTLRLPKDLGSQHGLSGGARLAWTLYRSTEPGPSRVSWVSGGVVCQEENIHSPFDRYQVRLFVSAEDLPTDLTALHVRFPSRQERYDRIARAVLYFCHEIEAGRPAVAAVAESQKTGTGAWIGVVGIMLGSVLVAPATSGLSVLGGIGASVGYTLREKKLAKQRKLPALEHFRSTLRQRYKGHVPHK